MCCFSVPRPGVLARLKGPALHVANTRIFARHLDDTWQGLAYAMDLSVGSDVAMILPLPVAPGAGEAGLEFIDLSAAPKLFEQLADGFPVPAAAMPRSRSLAPAAPRPRLKVHAVGSFDASFVPAVDDFDRLDPRFQLPRETWDAIPAVADFGFAVFMLRKGQRQRVHPMGLRFRRRDARLFFPTVHIHDGQVHPNADFDHTLYAQGIVDEAWGPSFAPAEQFVDIDTCGGLVQGDRRVFSLTLAGRRPNADTWA